MGASAIRGTAGPSAGRDAPWLFGRWPDLLLGCGLGYVLSIPVLASLEVTEGELLWPGWLAALLALLISGPHYGATILRAYGRPEDRRKYVFFTLYATVALGALLVAGLHWVWVGSLLITLYASWAPWHFAGQNYGIALMLLGRRNVEVTPAAKRLLYVSFLLSFALALLEIHALAGVRDVLGIGPGASQEFRILRLGLPEGLVWPLTVALGVAYLGVLVTASALLLRRASWRRIAPAALVVVTQALWFALPAVVSNLAGIPLVLTLPFSLVWVSAAHSTQYLWVTAYYDRRSNPDHRPTGFLWRCLLAGSALNVAPGLVLAPSLFGPVAWDSGLAMVLFSVVNLHHFLLDGAIWKLRDGRVARALLRNEPVRAVTQPQALPGWRRPVGIAIGLACVGIAMHELWEVEFVYSGAGADAERARGALERLRWTGRDSPRLRLQTGQVLLSQGHAREAVAEFERGLELKPSAEAWSLLGLARQRLQEWEAAADAHARALALDPDEVRALVQGALVDLRLAGEAVADEAARMQYVAERKLARALVLHPGHDVAARQLARLLASRGRIDEAISVLETAEAAASPRARPELQRQLRDLVAQSSGASPTRASELQTRSSPSAPDPPLNSPTGR